MKLKPRNMDFTGRYYTVEIIKAFKEHN